MIRPIGQNGLDLVQNREGTVDRIYLDNAGNKTGGMGHLITASDEAQRPWNVGDAIPATQIALWARHDLCAACAAVEACGLDLTDNQFGALVDFTFQEGAGSLQQLIEGANRDLSTIAAHFAYWTRSKNVHPRGIVIRRLLDRDLFLTPDDVPMDAGWLGRYDHLTNTELASLNGTGISVVSV